MEDTLIWLQHHPVIFLTFTGALGLCIGSFLNVVIYRLPIMLEREFEIQLAQASNQSIPDYDEFDLLLPASHCPHCKTPIKWWQNIPVISYIILRARSRCCDQPIALRYPLIELLCMIMSMLVVNQYGISWAALAALLFTWGLTALIFIDIDKFLLPDSITLPLLWLGLYFNVFGVFTNAQDAILGAIAGYTIFWSVGYLFKKIRGIDGLGQGDYKLLAALGAWMGWQQLPFIIMLSSFIGAACGLALLVTKRKKSQEPIPFGPFLAIAGVIALFFGNDITFAYFHWLGLASQNMATPLL